MIFLYINNILIENIVEEQETKNRRGLLDYKKNSQYFEKNK